jgi:protocatechuate 3,4-dioxygenase beta subunit
MRFRTVKPLRIALPQAPSYRRAAIWWVVSARRDATRLKRAQALVELSAAARLIPQFTRRH